MKEIRLTNSDILAQVDDEDYNKLANQKWYVITNKKDPWIRGIRNAKKEYIHFAICGNPPVGFQWDHKDQNKFNNQKSNLRLATPSQNKMNRKTPRNNASGYKGVSWSPERLRYRAYINKNGKQYNLGRFSDPKEAARAYDAAAIKLFGEFACTNF